MHDLRWHYVMGHSQVAVGKCGPGFAKLADVLRMVDDRLHDRGESRSVIGDLGGGDGDLGDPRDLAGYVLVQMSKCGESLPEIAALAAAGMRTAFAFGSGEQQNIARANFNRVAGMLRQIKAIGADAHRVGVEYTSL